TPTITPTPSMTATATPQATTTPTDTPSPTPTQMTSAAFSTVDFIAVPAGGTCGASRDGAGAPVKERSCGLLSVGGGGSAAPALNAQSLRARFAVNDCTGTNCTLGATSEAQAAPLDCTETGCPIGAPVPVTVPLPTCSGTTWSAPGEGSVDFAEGTA